MNRAQFLKAAAAAAVAARLPRLDAFAAGENLQHFVSRPDLKPPKVATRGSTNGLVFLAPSSGPGNRGPMIVDAAGELVWFKPLADASAMDFKVQRWRGRPVLTWWEGKSPHGIPRGEWVLADTAYRELARFGAARGRNGDLHELVLSPEGTALVTCTEIAPSRSGTVVGGIVQELELPSGRLIHEWRSLDHVRVDETAIKAAPGPRFDYFHVNSIDVADDGHLIVSARNTWAAYKIARRSGRIMWRLGGKRSDFPLERSARFYWQHDVRQHADGTVSVFDNGAAPAEEPRSRVLLLHVDERRKRVTLERAFTHRPERVLSHFMGNAQLLPNGHVFTGWGGSRFMTEFAASGAILFDAALPPGGQSYRAFTFDWTGRPAGAPTARAANGAVYASWNGATEVVAWQLVEDARAGQTVRRTGFETALRPTSTAARVVAVALDAHGRALGRSAPVVV